MLRWLIGILALAAAPASAQQRNTAPTGEPVISRCIAIAQSTPGATYANLTPQMTSPAMHVGSRGGAVEITYAGHSTYLIETPGGVRIATDFSGVYGNDFNPRIATMNKAHRDSLYADPIAFDRICAAWLGRGGEPAKHGLQVEDVLVRNVTTDIRSWGGEGLKRDANSIFIFEVADLCIGHLGHLHTKLSDQQFGKIGRLDILMVPVDGGLTQNIGSMSEVARRLYSSIILPMHRHSMSIGEFSALMGSDFAVHYQNSRSLRVSVDTLPNQPTIVLLDGV